MTIISSFASISKNGFQAPKGSGSTPPPGGTYYYFNALNTKGNNSFLSGTNGRGALKSISSSMYQYGTGAGSTGIQVRPFVVNTDYTGAMVDYKIWDLNYYYCKGVCYDSSGNQHVLFSYNNGFLATPIFRLLKYDAAGNQLMAKSFTFPTGSSVSNATFGMVIDSSDNLYIGSVYVDNFAITKVDTATYTVQWCVQNSGTVGANWLISSCRIHIDSSNNITVVGKYYAGSPTPFDFIAFQSVTSAGVHRYWKYYVTTYTAGGNVDSCIDPSGNIYGLFGNAILKHTSAGTLTYTKTVPTATVGGNTPDSYYSNIAYNSLGNIVLGLGGSAGWFIASITNAGVGVSYTSWTLTNNWDVIGLTSDASNTYMLGEYNNGLGKITLASVKSNANGTVLAGSNGISFSQTQDNGTVNSWTGTISTTAGSVPATGTVSYGTGSGGSVSSLTLTVATITMNTSATVPVMYAQQLT